MPRAGRVAYRLSRQEIRAVVIGEYAVENKDQLGRVVPVFERARSGLQTHPVTAPGAILIVGDRNPQKAGQHCCADFHRLPVALVNGVTASPILDVQAKRNCVIVRVPGNHVLPYPLSVKGDPLPVAPRRRAVGEVGAPAFHVHKPNWQRYPESSASASLCGRATR
jgi:hypothetical protein